MRVHLKDFKVKSKGGPLVADAANLGEGDIDWPEVRKVLREVGYSRPVTCELNPGDETYLRDLSHRVDRLVLGL